MAARNTWIRQSGTAPEKIATRNCALHPHWVTCRGVASNYPEFISCRHGNDNPADPGQNPKSAQLRDSPAQL